MVISTFRVKVFLPNSFQALTLCYCLVIEALVPTVLMGIQAYQITGNRICFCYLLKQFNEQHIFYHPLLMP